MRAADGDGPPEWTLPESLTETLDEMEPAALQRVIDYARARVDARRVPIAEQIRAEAAGEVTAVEDHGAYAVVRMRTPDETATDDHGDHTSVYHVQRDHTLRGDDALHWTFIGRMAGPGRRHCVSCGRPLEGDRSRCSHCGANRDDGTPTGE